MLCFRNRCYAGEDREEGDGVFDVTVCQFGAPIVLSWPHFLGADQKYTDAVEGLNPEKVKRNEKKTFDLTFFRVVETRILV